VPKLFEYFGLIVLFYSNEHDPVHVHGLYGERETRAELLLRNGKVVRIRFVQVKGRMPLGTRQMKAFRRIVDRYRNEIVQKWVDFFVLHKPIRPQVISRRLP
jgi:hypothetical protein